MPTKIYLIVVVAIQILYFFHVLAMGSPLSALDNISRIVFGLVNGAFFFFFLNYRRQPLFLFLVLLALLHASVSILAAFHQAMDFASLGPSEWRLGGATNPIPFSEMLLASVGLVAIYWSGKIHKRQGLRSGLLLTLILVPQPLRAALTGTRGTSLAVLPLALLTAGNARSRGGQLYLLGAIVVLEGLAISFTELQDRFLLLFGDLRHFGSGSVDPDALSEAVWHRAEYVAHCASLLQPKGRCSDMASEAFRVCCTILRWVFRQARRSGVILERRAIRLVHIRRS